MIYEYEDIQTGEVVEISKPDAQRDPVGRVITHNGRKVRRILSTGAQTILPVKDEPRPRNNLPRFMPGCECDKRGRPVITNAQGKNMGLVPNPHLDNPAWRD
jgi:hypothetical protein